MRGRYIGYGPTVNAGQVTADLDTGERLDYDQLEMVLGERQKFAAAVGSDDDRPFPSPSPSRAAARAPPELSRWACRP